MVESRRYCKIYDNPTNCRNIGFGHVKCEPLTCCWTLKEDFKWIGNMNTETGQTSLAFWRHTNMIKSTNEIIFVKDVAKDISLYTTDHVSTNQVPFIRQPTEESIYWKLVPIYNPVYLTESSQPIRSLSILSFSISWRPCQDISLSSKCIDSKGRLTIGLYSSSYGRQHLLAPI